MQSRHLTGLLVSYDGTGWQRCSPVLAKRPRTPSQPAGRKVVGSYEAHEQALPKLW